MSLIGTCPDCGKRFKVPHANQVWQCKACGVPLEGVVAPPKPADTQPPPRKQPAASAEASKPPSRKRAKESAPARPVESPVSRPRAGSVQARRRRQAAAPNRTPLWIGLGALALLAVGFLGYQMFGSGDAAQAQSPTPPDTVIEAFRSAWNAGDFEGIAALSAPDRRQKWVLRMERQNKRRNWNGQPPKLEPGQFTPTTRPRVFVRYPNENGLLVAQFDRVEGNRWILKLLDYRGMPKPE